jgi:Mg-chelatase subunit ChlD
MDEMPVGNESPLPKALATAAKVPAKYGSPASGLKATVTADGPNEFKFELAD